MKEKLKELGYWLEDRLKGICGELTPDKRIVFILVMLLILTIGNLYFTFSTIYNWGKESERKKQLKIEHIKQPEMQQNRDRDYDFMDSPIDGPEAVPDSIYNDSINSNNEKFNAYERTINNQCAAQTAT